VLNAIWTLRYETYESHRIHCSYHSSHPAPRATGGESCQRSVNESSNPSPTAPYDQLKTALLERTEASESPRWQQLVPAEELGDPRPSQLLHGMTQLLREGANAIDDVLLRELFLQRHSPNDQVVLAAAAPLSLAGPTVLASAVMEVSTPSSAQIAATTTQSAADAPNMAQCIQTPNMTQGYTFTSSANIFSKSSLLRQDAENPIVLRAIDGALYTSRRPDSDSSDRDHSSGLC
ncbi:hypothetical protein HPB47_024641, partial [Ixodes persulcatus]